MGSKKKKKRSDEPKRPCSSYIHFANAQRNNIRESNPEMSMGEIGKELGKRWRELSDADKKPYIELNTKDKERYEREMEEYKKKHPELVGRKKKAGKRKSTKKGKKGGGGGGEGSGSSDEDDSDSDSSSGSESGSSSDGGSSDSSDDDSD